MRRALALLLGLGCLTGCASRQVVENTAQGIAPTAPAHCSDSQLQVSAGGTAEGGHANGYVTFSGTGCSLYGFPVLVVTTSSGSITASETETSSPGGGEPTVTLSGSTRGQAGFSWDTAQSTGPAQQCPTLTGITVTAPGDATARTLPLPAGLSGKPVCTTPVLRPVKAVSA